MILKRVLKLIRCHFPDTHTLVRGDGHFSNPELMQMIGAMPNTDFVFGLGLGYNTVLARHAGPVLTQARAKYAQQQHQDGRHATTPSSSVRLFDDFSYAAGSWHKPFRVILKAEVMALGDNSRFVVTSLDLPYPQTVYTELYCARGQAENFIKHLKCDLAANRTSCTTFLANCMRLALHAAADVLHQKLCTQALKHTALVNAQPESVILKLFKITVQVKQYQDRVILHLPSAYLYKYLLWQLTERLYLSQPARVNSS